ncbi:uncharacterized protein J4E84_009356 [Alternaria hordeiaustralica]|uniref:uncharacterized protein n=1 Tax=Alternaria hordeiaustralica TaxID=1187925 RepID=UPI0020C4F452|nr:uncharacterized protein J4E84_009356 [Alternaria hordeiaustralica]KAI4676762.1 hypothetical protein J4E84_009356 [Alternaria hordeiaustralica]
MSDQNPESTNCQGERPKWQEEGFSSHQEWQDWRNEYLATDNAYDTQAEDPSPDDSDEDEGFDEEFVSEQDSDEDEDEDNEESESGEPGKHVEPEDDSSPDHSEAADNGEPGVDDTSNVDETVLTSIYGFAHDKNKDYALVEQSARGALNAITIALQDIINKSQARQGEPESLAKEIESAFATTLPTYLSVQAVLQGGHQTTGRSPPFSAISSQRNQPLIGTSAAVSVPPSPSPPPPSTTSGLVSSAPQRNEVGASQGDEDVNSDSEEEVEEITPPHPD